ncbi:SMI1/KNR4 family protein [Paractinoplanes durhamensis]|uniref:SMI1/KNR4 family protein n=1 Tax=Paractinoplanes durhamensis TaxID=113563 RepID=UPI0019442851|nr:SMI1/KNR4 family protein [Actinoplanes durhamensis]
MNDGFDLYSELVEGVRDAAAARRFIRRFAARYASPVVAGDGCDQEELRAAEDRLGFPLPVALREVYALIGRRLDLTRSQDLLLAPHRVSVEEAARVLVFRWECQHVAEWGIPLSAVTESDPPVVSRHDGEQVWHPFLDRVSLACVEMVLSEWLATGDAFGANLHLDDETVALLESQFRRLPLPDYPRWADMPPVRWFEGLGAVLREDAGTWLWVRAPSADAITAVQRALPGDWSTDEV